MWFSPVPQGLTLQTWHLFSIFLSIVVALILKPLPMGTLAILGIALCTLRKTLTI